MDRLTSHKRSHCKIDDAEKQLWLGAVKAFDVEPTVAKRSQSCFSGAELSTTTGQFAARKFMDEITMAGVGRAIELLATWVYRTNQPFSVVNAPSFKSLLGFLRPAFVKFIPSPNTLAGSLLDAAYDNVKAQTIAKVLSQKHFTIISDMWTDVSHRHIINVMIQTPLEKPFFFKSMDTTGVSVTAEWVFEFVVSIAKSLGIEKWLSFISDNAATMQATWKKIENAYPLVFAHGCIPHGLNCFLKDLVSKVESIKQLMEQATLIIKFITNHSVILGRFREIQDSTKIKKSLKMPVDTRFSTYFLSLTSLIENRINLIQLSEDDSIIGRNIEGFGDVKEHLDNGNFWLKIKFVANSLMKNVANTITQMEADESHVGLAYKSFFTLRKYFETLQLNYEVINRDTLLDLFTNRWNFMHSHTMAMAYVLSPNAAIDDMYEDETYDDYQDALVAVKHYIHQYYIEKKELEDDALKQFGKYCRQFDYLTEEARGVFAMKDPRDYWATEGKCQFPLLAPLASRLFAIPSSNCSSERNFKCFSNIITKKRNRLTADKAEKLVFVQTNFFLLDDEDKVDYNDIFSINE